MSRAAGEPSSLLGISKVLAELRAEFPELSPSKLRYLDREGLVEPQRTDSGYRKYSYGDVERLRFVLRMQRERYWPLSRIRQELDELEAGRVPQVHGSGRLRIPDLALAEDGLPVEATFTSIGGREATRFSREELIDAAGIDESLLDAIEEHGLIHRRPAQRYYDADALQVASLVALLAELGLEPRHLRGFSAAADREVSLYDQVVPPAARAGEEARATLAQLAALSVRLHTVLVRSRLRG